MIAAFMLANLVKWVLIDPFATVAMIVSYQQVIQGQVPSYDLKGQITRASGGFRKILDKADRAPGPLPSA